MTDVRGGALRGLPVGAGQGDQVHPVELVGYVAPGAVSGVLDHAQQEQREPAELHMGAVAIFAVVGDRPEPEVALRVAPAAFDLQQLLVGRGQVVGVSVVSLYAAASCRPGAALA